MPALLPLLRAGGRPEMLAAAARAVGNLARDPPSAGLLAEVLPALLALLAKPKPTTPPAVLLDCLWGVTNLYLGQPEAFAAPTTLAPLAAAAVAMASNANAEVQRAAAGLQRAMALRRDARAALQARTLTRTLTLTLTLALTVTRRAGVPLAREQPRARGDRERGP